MITDADKQRFDEQGYLLVKGLVDEARCQGILRAGRKAAATA
jgi:hypothetical protein